MFEAVNGMTNIFWGWGQVHPSRHRRSFIDSHHRILIQRATTATSRLTPPSQKPTPSSLPHHFLRPPPPPALTPRKTTSSWDACVHTRLHLSPWYHAPYPCSPQTTPPRGKSQPFFEHIHGKVGVACALSLKLFGLCRADLKSGPTPRQGSQQEAHSAPEPWVHRDHHLGSLSSNIRQNGLNSSLYSLLARDVRHIMVYPS